MQCLMCVSVNWTETFNVLGRQHMGLEQIDLILSTLSLIFDPHGTAHKIRPHEGWAD